MDLIQLYEFSTERLEYFREIATTYNAKKINKKQQKQTTTLIHDKLAAAASWFTPNITNVLFWQIYIILYGIEKFNYYTHKSQIESEEIFKIIEKSKCDISFESKKLLRKHKIKIQDIMNDLACTLKVDIDTFISICILLNIPLVILRNKYCISYGEYEEYYILKYETFELYFKKTVKPDIFVGETLHMPMKSISAYKLSELQQIAASLNMNIVSNTGKKKTKQILYEELSFYLID